MPPTCHLCGSELAEGESPDGTDEWFECADCGRPTCAQCRSIGVGRDSDHCRRCRG